MGRGPATQADHLRCGGDSEEGLPAETPRQAVPSHVELPRDLGIPRGADEHQRLRGETGQGRGRAGTDQADREGAGPEHHGHHAGRRHPLETGEVHDSDAAEYGGPRRGAHAAGGGQATGDAVHVRAPGGRTGWGGESSARRRGGEPAERGHAHGGPRQGTHHRRERRECREQQRRQHTDRLLDACPPDLRGPERAQPDAQPGAAQLPPIRGLYAAEQHEPGADDDAAPPLRDTAARGNHPLPAEPGSVHDDADRQCTAPCPRARAVGHPTEPGRHQNSGPSEPPHQPPTTGTSSGPSPTSGRMGGGPPRALEGHQDTCPYSV